MNSGASISTFAALATAVLLLILDTAASAVDNRKLIDLESFMELYYEAKKHDDDLLDLPKHFEEAYNVSGSSRTRIVALVGTLQGEPTVAFDRWSSFNRNAVEFVVHSFHASDSRRDEFYLVNFDDGTNTKHLVRHGSSALVSYPSPGVKQILAWRVGSKLRAENPEPTHATQFLVQAQVLPTPDVTWTVATANASANAYIFRSPLSAADALLRKPLVIVEGFDPVNDNPTDDIYRRLNVSGTWNGLQQTGWDVIIVDLLQGATAMQDNAMVLKLVIDRVGENKEPNAQIALLGLSMGGVLARYALTWMERNQLEHNVGLYMSFDSPHWGANVPPGDQYFVRFASLIPPIGWVLHTVLNSIAAKQLLIYHESFDAGSGPDSLTDIFGSDVVRKEVKLGPDPLHTQFFDELKALGNYPTKPRKVAFSNGNGNGLPQGFNGSQILLSLTFQTIAADVTADSFALGSNLTTIFKGVVDPKIPFVESYFERTYSARGLSFDYAPGGTLESTEAISDAAFYLQNRLVNSSRCFIPALSAIDSENKSDPFAPAAQAQTPFDAVYFASGANEAHLTISDEKREQLLAELAKINQ